MRSTQGMHDKAAVVASLFLVTRLFSAVALKRAAHPPFPRSAFKPHFESSALVHLFEWSWADVATECEQWLGPKGFTAVQVSPPNDHIDHPAWWARYQPVTYTLHSRSGNETAFADMVKRCANVGVGIYVDAVINHAAAGSGVSIAGNKYGKRQTPIWKPQDFHHHQHSHQKNCGISNYQNKYNVQYCDLLGLPDLCTECSQVRARQVAYFTHMAELGVRGFRVDAAKHMEARHLHRLMNEAAPGHSVFWYQEVYAPRSGQAVTTPMYTSRAPLEYFDYARHVAKNFIPQGKLKYFHSFGEKWGLISRNRAVVFLDNHDTQRGEALLSHKGSRIYELASVFMLAHPYGFPKIMSSYYFKNFNQGPPSASVHGQNGELRCGGHPSHVSGRPGKPWVCEHRWPSLANMVRWRRTAGAHNVDKFWAKDGNRVLLCRGPGACVFFNRHGGKWWKVTHKLPLRPGRYCNVIESDNVTSCPTVTVDHRGYARVEVPPIRAVALHAGVMVPEEKPEPARTCASKQDNCENFECCKDAGHRCYQKNPWWSSCLPQCRPGMRDNFDKLPWSCNIVW